MNFSGYASVTEVPYDMGFYDETVARGAFKKTLSEKPDTQLLINHGGLPLARTLSGTLQLSEDDVGLRMEADLDDGDPDVQSLARKMSRGDINQCSFSFRANRQKWNEDYSARRILECDIHRGDVSVVNMGASPMTSASMRSAVIRSGGRSAIPERKRLAETLGNLAVVELRSLSLDGMVLELRAAGDNCGRCNGEGTIDLGGKSITCPQCKGTGGPEGNADTSEDDDSTRARDLALSTSADVAIARARLDLYLAQHPDIRRQTDPRPARLRLEALRYPPKGK